MPVMDGYAATRALRQRPQWRDLPVVAMTANAMVGDREKVLAAGMNDHIAKPINVNELFATLARWARKPAVPKLDLRAPPASMAGNEQLYRRVAGLFLEREADFRRCFAAARASADTEAALRRAHDLKCEAGILGATALSEAAAALEQACSQSAAASQVDALLEAVVAQLEAVIAGLRAMPESAKA